MRKVYSALAAAMLAFISMDASAFTVAQIAGEYEAKDMDFSMNYSCFMSFGVAEDLEAVSWTMQISVIEGNNVKLTQFMKEGINYGLPNNKFDMEGVFDPATNTITIAAKDFNYPNPGFSFLPAFERTIAKYDGVTDVAENSSIETFESFNATFDSNMNLTVSPWAIYTTTSKQVNCIPDYNNGTAKGTYFTRNGSIDIEGPTGIESVGYDSNAPVEYFNLQGVKVENPESGLYIRRQGNKVEKIIIR